MSKDYETGYKKPPKQHQFKPGNQMARKNKGKKRKPAVTMADALLAALHKRRKIRKGDQHVNMTAIEFAVERLISLAMSGNVRDLATFLEIINKFAPDTLSTEPDELEITIKKATGSDVELPGADQWKTSK